MKWTDEFPEESGTYWWRSDPDDDDPELYDIDITNDTIYGLGSSDLMRLDTLGCEGGEFLGPITPDSLTRVREEAFDEAIAIASTAFDKQPGDSQSYHDNTMVNASAVERRVKHALEAARDNKEK